MKSCVQVRAPQVAVVAVTEVLQAEETAVVCSTTDGLEQDITIKDHVVERAVETSPLNLNKK